jgi:ribonuclease HI
VRQDARRLRELIHPDFTEIGRSGRLWTRSDLLVELVEEATRDTPHTDEWVIQRLDVDTVLVTYRLVAGTRVSRHSSVWATSGDALALRFHQGTEQSPADARP